MSDYVFYTVYSMQDALQVFSVWNKVYILDILTFNWICLAKTLWLNVYTITSLVSRRSILPGFDYSLKRLLVKVGW